MKALKLWMATATLGFLCPIIMKLTGYIELGWYSLAVILTGFFGLFLMISAGLLTYYLLQYAKQWEHQ